MIGLSCLLFSEGIAADGKILQLLFDDGTGKREIKEIQPRDGKADYIAELGSRVISVDLGHFHFLAPERVEIRHISGWAVGEDGPWVPLEGIDKSSSWSELKAEKFEVMIPEAPEAGDESLSSAQYEIAYRNLAKSEGSDKWLSVLKTCRDQQGACYSYHAADEIRFTWPDTSSLLVTVFYPGGC